MSQPILIVEDSADDAQLLRSQLRRAGLCNPCHAVSSAEEAITYLEGAPPYEDRSRFPAPAVILLDIKLPGLDGHQFLQWINARPNLAGILVVVISGADDLSSIRRAYQLGARSFITKPCSVAELQNLFHGFPGYWTRTPLSVGPMTVGD